MIAALTFDPGRLLVVVLVVLGFVLVAIWGIAEAERDRVKRASHRALLGELRRQRSEP